MFHKIDFKHRILPFMVSILLTISLTLLINQDGAHVSADDTITVNPTPDTTYLPNPGMGWQFGDGVSPQNQLLPETVSYATRADIGWSTLNPNSGVYNWTALDNYINRAKNEGKQISFRVYTMRGEDWGGHQIPQWVLTNGATILRDGSPDYSNCTYQHEWSKFVNALRLRYDGNTDIAFIDISGYGNFNEWSWTDSQTTWENNPDNPTTLDARARQRLADMFIGGSSTNHPCHDSSNRNQTLSYSYIGFQKTQLVMPYAGMRQTTHLIAQRRTDVGIRFDCLGRLGSTQNEVMGPIGADINAVWPHAPIIYEFCGGVGGNNANMVEAENLLRLSHASIVHDTLYEPRNVSRVTSLMLNVGYRYQMQSATYTSQVASGQTFNINMSWRNIGYAPSYPKMGQVFTLHLYVLNAQGTVVVNKILPTQINTWMPAQTLPGTAPQQIVSDSFVMPALPNGNYTLRVAMVETRTGNPINLAMAGRDSAGRYPLGAVTISGDAVAVQPSATITSTPQPVATNTPLPTATTISAVQATMTALPPPLPTATNTPITIPTATPIAPLPGTNPPVNNPPVVNPPNNGGPITIPPLPGSELPQPPVSIPPANGGGNNNGGNNGGGNNNNGGNNGGNNNNGGGGRGNNNGGGGRGNNNNGGGGNNGGNNNNGGANNGGGGGNNGGSVITNPNWSERFDIHVGDLDGSSQGGNGNRWDATVRITIHTQDHVPIADVDIRGSFNHEGWEEWCKTDNTGSCVIRSRNIQGRNSVRFTITRVANWQSTYRHNQNHDADGDSNGTTITISR